MVGGLARLVVHWRRLLSLPTVRVCAAHEHCVCGDRRREAGGVKLQHQFWLPFVVFPLTHMSNGGGANPLPPVPAMAEMAASRRRLFDRCKMPICSRSRALEARSSCTLSRPGMNAAIAYESRTARRTGGYSHRRSHSTPLGVLGIRTGQPPSGGGGSRRSSSVGMLSAECPCNCPATSVARGKAARAVRA